MVDQLIFNDDLNVVGVKGTGTTTLGGTVDINYTK